MFPLHIRYKLKRNEDSKPSPTHLLAKDQFTLSRFNSVQQIKTCTVITSAPNSWFKSHKHFTACFSLNTLTLKYTNIRLSTKMNKHQCTKYETIRELRHLRGWDNAHRPRCIRPGSALRWPEWAQTRRGLNPSSSADLCWHSAKFIRLWTLESVY